MASQVHEWAMEPMHIPSQHVRAVVEPSPSPAEPGPPLHPRSAHLDGLRPKDWPEADPTAAAATAARPGGGRRPSPPQPGPVFLYRMARPGSPWPPLWTTHTSILSSPGRCPA